MIAIEGHAIVTADGMIAAADGTMPPALRNDADWRAFQAALDRSVLVVVGRLGHQRHSNPGRRRLVVTRSVEAIAPDRGDRLATLWNPAGASFESVLDHLAIDDGVIAVTGGTGAFDLFVRKLDRFALVEVHNLVMPGGRSCFTTGHPRAVLAAAGLVPETMQVIDEQAGVTSTLWRRMVSG